MKTDYGLVSVATDGLDRATFHRLFAKCGFGIAFRLLVEVAVATVVVALEVSGGGFATEVAVNALVVHVECARDVFRIFVRLISHKK